MPSYINHAALYCTLGNNLEECIKQFLQYPTEAKTIKIDSLIDPVKVPYFTLHNHDPIKTKHDDLLRLIDQQIQSSIDTLNLSAQQLSRTGLLIGSSSYFISQSEQDYQATLINGKCDELPLSAFGYGRVARNLASRYGLSPHCYSYSTACTSSANAILNAHTFLEKGIINHAIVIGYEFFNLTTPLGFYGLELLSRQNKILPFDARRDGLILGEACSTLCISKEKTSNPLKLLGGACKTDHHNLTAANTDGSSIQAVIEKALLLTQTDKNQVRSIKLHGTASKMNDEAEAAGLIRTFGSTMPPLYAIKPYIGHTLGACGSAEFTLAAECLNKDILPANPGIADKDYYDRELGLQLRSQNTTAEDGIHLFNYFGFGGNNTVLVAQKGAGDEKENANKKEGGK